MKLSNFSVSILEQNTSKR